MKTTKFLAAALVAATAIPTFAFAEAGDDTMYLRVEEGVDGCADQVLYIDDQAGSPDESACGYVGGFAFDTVFGEPKVFGLDKGAKGFRISGDEATGQITVNHGQGLVGGGAYEIELVLKINGKVAGETTASAMTGSLDTLAIDFTMPIDASLAGATVTSMTLDVLMGGVFLNSGYLAAGDASFINLPRK